jgi:phosphohistidine phosphatase
MFLYLVQHAEAKKEEEDPARGLSEKGLNDIQKVASLISKSTVSVAEIFHSSKLRAAQTAQVLADALKPEKGVSEKDGLSPLEDPSLWQEKILTAGDNTMLVGHLPHLGKLASLLMCGDAEKHLVSFKMAGIACLERYDNHTWSLQWMITPDLIP